MLLASRETSGLLCEKAMRTRTRNADGDGRQVLLQRKKSLSTQSFFRRAVHVVHAADTSVGFLKSDPGMVAGL